MICTELRRQGLVGDEVYAADCEFGRQQDPQVLRGYHLWAPSVVRAMRRSRIFTGLVSCLAQPWMREMAHRQGLGSRGSLVGRAIMIVGLPFCRMLGRYRDEQSTAIPV